VTLLMQPGYLAYQMCHRVRIKASGTTGEQIGAQFDYQTVVMRFLRRCAVFFSFCPFCLVHCLSSAVNQPRLYNCTWAFTSMSWETPLTLTGSRLACRIEPAQELSLE